MSGSCHPDEPGSREADPAPPESPPDLRAERVMGECDEEFVRASGPGGQHRNRRETGVRLTHRPTGVVVMATERRSQLANRKLALERMLERLERLARKPKPRKKTRKPRGIRNKELESKRRTSEKKKMRGSPRDSD